MLLFELQYLFLNQRLEGEVSNTNVMQSSLALFFFFLASVTLPLYLGYAQFHTSLLVSKTELAKWSLWTEVYAAQKLILVSVN